MNESATGYALANLSIAALTATGLTVNAAQSNFNDSAGAVIAFQKSASAKAWIANRSYGFHDGNGLAINTTDANPIRFGTNNSERMRLDSSGNLLVATTSLSAAVDGFRAQYSGQTITTTNNAPVQYLNRRTSDGEIIVFRKDNGDIGDIRANGGAFVFKGASASAPVQIQTFDGNEDIEVDPDGFIKFETTV